MLEGLLKHGATAACTVHLTNLVPNSSKTVQGSVSASLLHLRCLYPGIDTTENTKYDEYSTKWRSRRRHSLVSTISHHLVERLSRIPPGTGPLVAMQIDLSSKGARNLSVLQKIDSNFIEIVAEASDTAIYRFDPANTKWERFGAQGAVFITKNRQAPFHSLIILNKLDPDDYVLDLSTVQKAKIQEFFIMLKCSTSGAPLITGLWLRDDAERDVLFKAIIKYSAAGKQASSNLSASPPTKNSKIGTALTTSSVLTMNSPLKSSNIGAGALLLKMISTGNVNGASIDDLLTDKEISAKASASNEIKKVESIIISTKTATMSQNEGKASSSTKSSSILKSILNVSNTPIPTLTSTSTIGSTPFSPSPSTSIPAPAVIASSDQTLPAPPSVSISSIKSQKLANILLLTKSDSPSLPTTSNSNSSSSSRVKSSGVGLVPASIQLKNLAKKFKEQEQEKATLPPSVTASLACISSSLSVPSMISVGSPAAASVIQATIPNPSAPVQSVQNTASLLAALSIAPKCAQPQSTYEQQKQIQTQQQQYTVSSSSSTVATATCVGVITGGGPVAIVKDTQSAQRLVSVMHLLQPQTTTQPIASNLNRPEPILIPTPASTCHGNEISISKSATLFAALNVGVDAIQSNPVKDAKLPNQPPPRYSQQSKAMPISPTVAAAAAAASKRMPIPVSSTNSSSSPTSSSKNSDPAPKLSLTPQSLSTKVERSKDVSGSEADTKTQLITAVRSRSDGSSSTPSSSSSSHVDVRSHSPSSITNYAPVPLPVATVTLLGAPMQSQPLDVRSISPSSLNLAKYVSYASCPATPPHLITPTPASLEMAHPALKPSALKSQPSQSEVILLKHSQSERIAMNPEIAPIGMKSLSPSDLTGYIRTFRSQS